MLIIGCDYHPSAQQIEMVDTVSGEVSGMRLRHPGEAEAFYRSLRGREVRVGVEATGRIAWFERLLQECGHEMWLGDASKIRAAEPRKQKTDKRDAELLLRLLVEGRFPRVWRATAAEREQKQVLLHRQKLVRMRTRVKNHLQHLAMNQGVRVGRKLWTVAGRELLAGLPLSPQEQRQRNEWLELHDWLTLRIAPLDREIERLARSRADTQRLMQHAGVGPNVALGFALAIGDVGRFSSSKQVASYLGLIPAEYSSGERQKLGHISKQGNVLVRWLLVEAAQQASKKDEGLRRMFLRLALKRHRSLARVAIARKLAVRLYWTLRNEATRPETPRCPVV